MIDLGAARWARGFALLIQPWPAARLRWRELFPLPKPRRATYQLQLPLTGGYWWGLLGRPEVEKPGITVTVHSIENSRISRNARQSCS
jgi:hypothetical protein